MKPGEGLAQILSNDEKLGEGKWAPAKTEYQWYNLWSLKLYLTDMPSTV